MFTGFALFTEPTELEQRLARVETMLAGEREAREQLEAVRTLMAIEVETLRQDRDRRAAEREQEATKSMLRETNLQLRAVMANDALERERAVTAVLRHRLDDAHHESAELKRRADELDVVCEAHVQRIKEIEDLNDMMCAKVVEYTKRLRADEELLPRATAPPKIARKISAGTKRKRELPARYRAQH